MKRKLLTFFLLLTLIFAVGCNKKDKNPEPTAAPAPTSTPTPVPVNLAKENLGKLTESYDKALKMNPNNMIDFSKGVGYDMTMDISVGEQILGLLGITGLDSIRVDASIDMKDTIAYDLGLFLDTSEVLSATMYMDSENMMINLPKYSSEFASYSMKELLEDAGYSDTIGLPESINPTNVLTLYDELLDSYRTLLTDFANNFKEDGIAPKSSIGTGDYVMTGDKHTVKANPADVVASLKKFMATMEKIYGDLGLDWTSLEDSEATALFLDYYTDEKGNYAWAFRTDEYPEDQIVFINTGLGFCLYKTEDGKETLGMTSIKSTENSGVIYIYFNDEELAEGELPEPMGTIDYEYSDTAVHADILVDTIEATLDYSTKNDIIYYDVTLVMDGLSFVIEETINNNDVDMTMTLASYGIKYASIDVDMTIRDYEESSAPANTVDLETWAAGLDQEALINDLAQLMTDYPFLATLFGGTEEDDGEEDWEYSDEPFVLPSDYTDDFMGLTGWSVDSDGYVDFEPLEDEVLAAGKPSTGYDMLALTDDQLQQLDSIAKTAITNPEVYSYTYYNVWGSAEYGDVASYYTLYCEYADPENWDNDITYLFDAVSGDFIGVDIYHSSKEEALRIANEIFKTVGGTYTITDTMVEEGTYDYDAGFSFYGYDAAPYGDNYYYVSFSILGDY